MTYPIVQDNDFSTWRAYDNRYWPAKYIIDKDGVIRYTHFGEGGYDETEKNNSRPLKGKLVLRMSHRKYKIQAIKFNLELPKYIWDLDVWRVCFD